MSKSAATRSRAGTTLSIDNSVMDRFGKLIRCTYNWYSGRYHKVIRGQDLLGIVLTIHHIALPLHLAVLSETRSLSYDQSRFAHFHVDTAQS